MIPFASQRGGGQDLATHLMNAYDNEVTEVEHIRGAIADDLHGAFKEWEAQADTLTRCRKYLYSMSINPDPEQGPLTREQYFDYIGRAEDMLGLGNQPRAVVFHIKNGREHCHVVWSRIDAENQRAVHIAFDRDKLMRVTRSFAHDHGLALPEGYDKSRKVGQETLYEREKFNQTGLSKDDHKRQVTEAWQQSDDTRAFVQALAEKGYILATGKRPYVLVDLYGGMHALSKLIDDKAVRIKDVRAFLSADFPEDSLPSVEEAIDLVTKHRKIVEKSTDELRYADRLVELKHAQAERRRPLDENRDAVAREHRAHRDALQQTHRHQRDDLRSGHLAEMKARRASRNEGRGTGLAAFLGKISGMTAVRKALHRFQDSRKVAAHLVKRKELRSTQEQEQKALDFRLKLQTQDMARRGKAVDRVEKREVAALMRDAKRGQRVSARGDDETMPSLVEIAGIEKVPEKRPTDVLSAFDAAMKSKPEQMPDLLSTFTRASWNASIQEAEDDSGARENDRDPAGPERDGPDRGQR